MYWQARFSLTAKPLKKIPCRFSACLTWWLYHQKSTPGTRILPATQATPGSFCMNCLDPHREAFASFPKKLTNARQLPGRGNEHACN